MKKVLRILTLASLMTFGLSNSYAGLGLSAAAYSNLANGNVLAGAITGGLGAASLITGVRLVQNGRVGLGVFFLILAENNVIDTQDVKVLEGLDVASQEAFLEIIASDESSQNKEEMLQTLFQ